jgi:hypothetical protein
MKAVGCYLQVNVQRTEANSGPERGCESNGTTELQSLTLQGEVTLML